MRYSSRANGVDAVAASCALRIFDAATICIALVICAVPLTDLMRRRRSRGLFISVSGRQRPISGGPVAVSRRPISLATGNSQLLLPRLLELVGGRLQFCRQL